MKVVITESANDGQFYPLFVGNNGEPWFWAEGYTRRADASRSVRDFFADLGTDGFIENGVIGFNVEIEHLDAQGRQIDAS